MIISQYLVFEKQNVLKFCRNNYFINITFKITKKESNLIRIFTVMILAFVQPSTNKSILNHFINHEI